MGSEQSEGIMATVQTAKTKRGVVLYNVDWRAYQAIGRALADRPALRLTYDRGVLEIMTTSPQHERFKHFLGRLLDAWTEEFGIPIAGYGSMTFKRQKRLRGLEPDECYWIAHEAQMRGRDRIDFRVDPPPDLVLEIDITRSSLNRMAIYGILGVPEVWRYSKGVLTFRLRQPDGSYAEVPVSVALPPLTPGDLMPFLAKHLATDETTIIRQFRTWIRQNLPGGSPPRTSP
jgi:Uma2 family endonuclease